MTTFFIKPKKTYFRAILGPFCQNLDKRIFLEKRAFVICQFLDIPIFYHRAKNQWSIPEKNAELMDRQSDKMVIL